MTSEKTIWRVRDWNREEFVVADSAESAIRKVKAYYKNIGLEFNVVSCERVGNLL